ncbi:class I SAM-dependent methyltransferase [Tenacibaculum geojense]|uniref:Class I SAM-dependent methyltransferase n=1 Tax=Tenacibaculum geojense TaxID=915352 RepID=A0ABW3JPU3_9FLAO
MNTKILQSEVQQFIIDNISSNITKLALKGSPFNEISTQELINQVVAKQKSVKKLPTWFQTKNIYYPPKISIEQTSSEITANYKSNIVSGNSLIDITGGFGIDAYYFAKNFTEVTHCEINEELSNIVNHNLQQLKATNIKTIAGSGLEHLKKNNKTYDCIYIDPSRRDDIKGKVFLLSDCLPNVPQNLDFLFSKSHIILLKNSPLLDIKATINELKFVKEIHIVAVQNEVKELLFLLQKGYDKHIFIKTINLGKNNNNEVFNFTFDDVLEPSYSEPQEYLYEPNAAILKSGGFNTVSNKLKINKLHKHSHLYTSVEFKDNFPGRSFKIIEVTNYNKKELRKISNGKANITTRNFPKTVAQIRKETKIKDGGDLFIFLTTDINSKLCAIICKKYIN